MINCKESDSETSDCLSCLDTHRFIEDKSKCVPKALYSNCKTIGVNEKCKLCEENYGLYKSNDEYLCKANDIDNCITVKPDDNE